MELILKQKHVELIKRFLTVKLNKEQVNTLALVDSVERLFPEYRNNSEKLERDIARILYTE